MYCQKCGTENQDDAQVCQSCGSALTNIPTQTPAPIPKTSNMAIASLVLAILSPFTCLITAIPAIILGSISLVKIQKSSGQLKGSGLAIAGIAIGPVSLPISSERRLSFASRRPWRSRRDSTASVSSPSIQVQSARRCRRTGWTPPQDRHLRHPSSGIRSARPLKKTALPR